MQPSPVLRDDDIPVGKYGKFLNKVPLGNVGTPIAQRGIITYGRSQNQQRISQMTPAIKDRVRIYSRLLLWWGPTLAVAYYSVKWAEQRNEYLNSKAGRKEFGDSA